MSSSLSCPLIFIVSTESLDVGQYIVHTHPIHRASSSTALFGVGTLHIPFLSSYFSFSMPFFHPCSYNHDHPRIYELVVRQEPKQARMCGVGGKGIYFKSPILFSFYSTFFIISVADRRPIDPPPIVQLRVIDPVAQQSGASSTPSRKRRNSSSGSAPGSPTPSATSTARAHPDDPIDTASYAQSFLQNPYYFMFASLARPDDDAELHWLKVNSSINIKAHTTDIDISFSRTVERGARLAQWSRPCIILKTLNTTTKVRPHHLSGIEYIVLIDSFLHRCWVFRFPRPQCADGRQLSAEIESVRSSVVSSSGFFRTSAICARLLIYLS